MILILSTSINLMPDSTLFWQLIIFLVLAVSLHLLIFKPILKLIDLRKEKTIELQKEAEKLNTESDKLQREYDETISKMREEGTFVQQEIIKQGRDLERDLVERARVESKTLIMKRRSEAMTAAQMAKVELGTKIEEISKNIISKLFGERE